jgi:hypothetical protein
MESPIYTISPVGWSAGRVACSWVSPHAQAILLQGGRNQTFNGMGDQASYQGESEGRISWQEVGRPCDVGLPIGPVLPCCVGVRAKLFLVD